MTDIVKRLRSIRGSFVIPIESPPIFQWAEDAADEIEAWREWFREWQDDMTVHAARAAPVSGTRNPARYDSGPDSPGSGEISASGNTDSGISWQKK